MLNYQGSAKFSKQHSDNRINKANESLSEDVVNRILAFAFYLLGANLREIAHYFDSERVTLKAMIQRILAEGLPAFEDRRRCRSTFLPALQGILEKPVLHLTPENIIVDLNSHHRIEIPRANKIQSQSVLLTLLNSKLLNLGEVARALGLSAERTRKLKAALFKEDASGLIDKRRGQQRDYRVTPELKAEMIQQFVLNISTCTPTTSEQLSLDLKDRCNVEIEPRTMRLHLAKLGLPEIRETLPHYSRQLKKNSKI